MNTNGLGILLLAGLLLTGALQAQQERRAPEPVPPRPPPAANVEDLPLFVKARHAAAERHAFAVRQGAQFLPTPDGRSFSILWLPAGVSTQRPPPMVFSLHGHGSWALDEFFLWQPHLAKAGYGLVALQWWFGEGEGPGDYYQPREIVACMTAILRPQKTAKRSVLAHGFSRGSANLYGVAALDNQADQFILLAVANAGKAAADFPINRDIAGGRFGPHPLEGTFWVTYAGAHDPHPDRSGIAGMRETRAWIRRFGGTVELAIEDAGGAHGGFHRNPANVKTALEAFRRLLAGRAPGEAPE